MHVHRTTTTHSTRVRVEPFDEPYQGSFNRDGTDEDDDEGEEGEGEEEEGDGAATAAAGDGFARVSAPAAREPTVFYDAVGAGPGSGPSVSMPTAKSESSLAEAAGAAPAAPIPTGRASADAARPAAAAAFSPVSPGPRLSASVPADAMTQPPGSLLLGGTTTGLAPESPWGPMAAAEDGGSYAAGAALPNLLMVPPEREAGMSPGATLAGGGSFKCADYVLSPTTQVGGRGRHCCCRGMLWSAPRCTAARQQTYGHAHGC